MRKRITILFTVATFTCLTLSGCGSNAGNSKVPAVPSNEASSDIMIMPELLCGGYTCTDAVGKLTVEEKIMFEKATEELMGVNLEAITVLGKQVVNGTNYAYLCKVTTVTAEPTSKLAVYIIHEEIGGEVSILNSKDFDMSELKEIETPSEELCGGWQMSENVTTDLPENVQSAFDKATESLMGVNYSARAFLGSQLVAGTNYMLICNAETVTADPESSVCFVRIYEDLEGNASVEEIYTIDVASYNE